MSDLGDAINDARADIAADAPDFMARTCSVIQPSSVSDGFHGHKLGETVIASSIPCTVEQVSGGIVINEGGVNEVKTHRLTLPVTDETLAITRKHKILAEAEGTTPEMLFEKPVTQLNDLDALMTIVVTQVIGYQQPAMT